MRQLLETHMEYAHWCLHLLDPLRVGVDVKPGGEQPASRPHLPQPCAPPINTSHAAPPFAAPFTLSVRQGPNHRHTRSS